MKIKVDENKCIGCGSCVSITNSEIFDFNDEGKACCIKEKIEEAEEEDVKTAIEYCPTSAITEEK